MERFWSIDTGLNAIAPVTKTIRDLAEPIVGEQGAGDVELALVEAITNVIRHGYGPEGGPVRVEAELDDGIVAFRIFDWGLPIPAKALAEAGLHRFEFDPEDIESLPVGGMGLSLIVVLMDDVSYTSENGQNTLSMRRGRRE